MIATIIILSTKKQIFFYVPNPKTDLQKKTDHTETTVLRISKRQFRISNIKVQNNKKYIFKVNIKTG